MELGAVFRQIFILDLRIADTGVEVQNAHFFQAVRQLFIQSPAKASFSCIGIEINGQLARPVVCSAADKGMCVCVTLDFSIPPNDEIWIFFHDITHAVLKFFQRRHVPLERNDGVFYIVSINLQNACGILQFCISYGNCTHNNFLLCLHFLWIPEFYLITPPKNGQHDFQISFFALFSGIAINFSVLFAFFPV